MQGLVRAVRSCHEHAVKLNKLSHHQHIKPSPFSFTKHSKGFTDTKVAKLHSVRDTTVAEILMNKGDEKIGSWLWCHTNDSVYDAVKQMAQNNIGSLVVLKPGEQHLVAGIFTERDYLRKMIVQDRSSKCTKVGEIMTDQDKLITVTSDTNILQAMQLMTENHIRHVPVIDGKIVGMISIGDVVKAVLEQQHGEVKQLNQFIHGDYY